MTEEKIWLGEAFWGLVKPPHRLSGLPQNRAMPARIAGYAALVWRHRVQDSLTVEIQAAPEALDTIAATISA